MVPTPTTTLSSAEWTGILFDCILFELSGRLPNDNNECDIKDISNALLLAWHIHKYIPYLFTCPFDNHIGKKDFNSIGIEQYINITRRCTFSIFPHQPSVSTRQVSYRVAGTIKQGVTVKDFLSLPGLSSPDTQIFFDRYATLVPSQYHDDFATLILILRDTWWKHGGSGGLTSSLPNGTEGVTKFSRKHNDKKRPTNTYFPPGELERLRLTAREQRADIETRLDKEGLVQLEVIKKLQGRLGTARLQAARLTAKRVEAAAQLKAVLLVADQLAVEWSKLKRVKAAQLEKKRLEVKRIEAERIEAERIEAERIEAERIEAERIEAERIEAERLKAERLKAERIETERIETERLKAERLKAERLKAERLKAERLKAERLKAERLKAERLKAERLEAGRVFTSPSDKVTTPTTTLSSAEWIGILFDCILFELSGRLLDDNNECDIKNISNALLLAWDTHKRKPLLFTCPFDNHIGKKDFNSIGIEQYINITRRYTFSIFPHQPSISTRHVPYHVAGTNKQGVSVIDFLTLPRLSSPDTQIFFDRYATLVPSRYHDDFATLILILRDTCWTHGGSGGSTSSLPNGTEGVTKFSKKHNDKKRPTNTYFPSGELERLRLAARELKADIETRQNQEELARLEAIKKKQERLEAVRLEAARLRAKRVVAAELVRLKAERLEVERLGLQQLKAARLEAERLEAERLEAERLEAERLEAERLEAERLEAERLEAERLEAERLEAERLEAERLEAERLEAERLEAERLEAERLEAERLEAERLEAERLEAERLEAERLEAERLETERLEAERLEAERLEAERLEAERLEAERLEAERLEAERLKAERLEAERLEAERLERQGLLKERQAKEERQKLELARLQALEEEKEGKQQQGYFRTLQKQMDIVQLNDARLAWQQHPKEVQQMEERQIQQLRPLETLPNKPEKQLQLKKQEKSLKSTIDSLSEYLSAIQVSQRSRQSDDNNVKALCRSLQGILQRYTNSPIITVHLFGSFRSGLCRMKSDADFTVYDFVQPFLGGNPIDELANALRWAGCQSVTTIANARVPIVTFVACGVQCDMSIDQPMAVHNSKLIDTYRMCDKRFLKLWFAVRHIACSHGILSGSTGYLSSYALVMMLIVFLQDVTNPPILPRLQQQARSRMKVLYIDGYDCSFDNDQSRYCTFGKSNTTSTSQLLIDFCQFYGYIFNYATQEVNPCLGVIKNRSYYPPPRCEWDLRPKDWSICILDPFVVGWNVAGNCRNNNAAEIQQCFQTVFDALSAGDLNKAFKE